MPITVPETVAWTARWLDPEIYRLNGEGFLPGLERVLDETVLRGGKRLRPLLMGEFALLFGIELSRITPFARAVEQVHSATLAHDDVIDHSDTRRGIATLNHRLENRRAVLGGDYLLADGLRTVAEQGSFPTLAALTNTLQELVTGEILQNEARQRADLTRANLARIHDLKTCSLFRWCCSVPALLTAADEECLRKVSEFATRLGLAFQLIDDALDFSPGTGKPVAQDLREGLLNAVSVRLLTDHPDRRAVVEKLFEPNSLFSIPWSDHEVRAAQKEVRAEASARLAGARVFLIELVESRSSLGLLPPGASTTRLLGLLDLLENRDH